MKPHPRTAVPAVLIAVAAFAAVSISFTAVGRTGAGLLALAAALAMAGGRRGGIGHRAISKH